MPFTVLMWMWYGAAAEAGPEVAATVLNDQASKLTTATMAAPGAGPREPWGMNGRGNVLAGISSIAPLLLLGETKKATAGYDGFPVLTKDFGYVHVLPDVCSG